MPAATGAANISRYGGDGAVDAVSINCLGMSKISKYQRAILSLLLLK